MKNWKYYILLLMASLLVGACSDDLEQESQDVDFCVRAAWKNGLDGGKATRALSATAILADGTEDIVIDHADYPATIDVKCSDGKEFTLTKGDALCSEHADGKYWKYASSEMYKDNIIKRNELTFTATAVIDGIENGDSEVKKDILKGEFGFEDIRDKHILVTLHHTKALLRFAFKVDPRYDKVRFIRVTGITLNGNDCYVKDVVLNKDNMTLIGYAYVDPTVVTISHENTIECTYNIYDKDYNDNDDDNDNHLTREGVVAQNKFKLGSLKKADGVTPVTAIQAGYYYDLKVTLNPDYLYVLSEHDNKHLVIN